MLAGHTLVLNKSWRVVNITTVKRAICLLYEGLARVVCPDTYETHDFSSWADLRVVEGEACIQTVRFQIKIPEVIQLNSYDGYPHHRVTFSRKNLYKRDKYTCQYCGISPGSEELTIDHVLPRSRGGRSEWINCVLACVKCNKRKGNKTLKESGMKLLNQPYRPEGTNALFFPLFMLKQSWKNFISEQYWNVELDED